jgi:type I restriction enzyme M protein
LKHDLHQKIDQMLDAIKGRTQPFDFLIALDQLCHLFFLKMLDEEEPYRVQQASPSFSSLKPLFPLQTARYRWHRWCGLPSDELLPFVRDEVFPYMGSLTRDDQDVGEHFRDAHFGFGNPESFATVITIISGFDFTTMSRDERVEFDQYLIGRLAVTCDDGSSYIKLSPALARLMLALTQPELDEVVFDPATGVGDLLIATLGHLHEGAQEGKRNHFSGVSLLGFEKSRQLVRICKVRLMLNGLRHALIHLFDLFTADQPDQAPGLPANVILAAPPMRTKAVFLANNLQYDRSPDFAFLQSCMHGLAPGGRCAIVVPDSVLAGTSRGLIALRERLITEFELLAVIKLPQNVLPAKANIKVSLLLFHKPMKLRSYDPAAVWFYEVRHLNDMAAGLFSISYLLKLWADYQASNFQQPPGPETVTRLSPDAATPCCWWASKQQVALANFNLEARKWQPEVADDALAVDPEILVDELISDYQKMVVGLQQLMMEIKEPNE